MNLIILPGNSHYNKDWLYESAEKFADLFNSIIVQPYKHWETGEEVINLDHEVEILQKNAEKLSGEYVIYAKSAGIVTTLKALSENKINPTKCIFVGCPFGGWAQEQIPNFNNVFSAYKIPTLFIQQTNDPFFKFEDLKKLLNDLKLTNYELKKVVGDNHFYDNYDEIKSLIENFLS